MTVETLKIEFGKNKIKENLLKVGIQPKEMKGVDLVVIAASTGGPVAVKKLLQGISPPISKPVFIVQHMPAGFTALMAKSLSKETNHTVIEAEHGEIISAGRVYLAPGGLHMMVKNTANAQKTIHLEESPIVNGVRPAADVLFSSIAEEYIGARVLAVVLTGMGSDGVEGIRKIKEKCFSWVIAQSERTSVVYGMPKRLVEAGLADEICDLDLIGARLQELIKTRSGNTNS